MSRSDWRDHTALVLIGLIFALLIGALWSTTETHKTRDEIERAAQRQTANRDAAERFALMNEVGQKTSTDERERAREYREESDLSAQWATATWTQAQFVASFFGLFFTGGALVFAYLAWQASKAGVQVAREIGQAQVRAYPAFSDGTIRISKTGAPIIEFTVTNAGQSPLKSFGVIDAFGFIHFNKPGHLRAIPAVSWVTNEGGLYGHQSLIGVGQPRDVEAEMPASDATRAAILAGMKGRDGIASCSGIIRWRDVFDVLFEQAFRFTVSFDTDGNFTRSSMRVGTGLPKDLRTEVQRMRQERKDIH